MKMRTMLTRLSGVFRLANAPGAFVRVGALCAVLMTVTTSPLQAQVAVGLRSGLNFANVNSSQFTFGNSSGRTAYTGGAFITVSGGGDLSMQVELLYSQKGISILGAGGNAVAKVDYVEVPVLLRLSLRDDEERIRPHLYAGTFLSFEAGCRAEGTLAVLDPTGDCASILPGRGETDAGFVLGGSVDYGLARRFFLTLDARLNRGLVNLNWDDEADNVRSRVWAISGGLGILLGS